MNNSAKFAIVEDVIGLAKGRYPATIDQIGLVSTGGIDPQTKERIYNASEQVKCVFTTPSGKQTHFFNTVGYTRQNELSEDLLESGDYEARGDAGYAVNKETGERVVHEGRTGQARTILGKFLGRVAKANGIKADKDGNVALANLQGAEIGIVVGPRKDNANINEFKFAVTLDQVAVESEEVFE